MALLEGHGDVTMNRAGAGLVPSAERFSRVLQARRRQTNVLQRLTGIAAKLDQYAAGERFIAAIEADGGPRAVDRCWTGPDALPTMEEIRDPQLWIDRSSPRPRPSERGRLIVDADRSALVDELLSRCQLPERPEGGEAGTVTCAVSGGADSLGAAGARAGGRVRGDCGACRSRAASGIRGRGRRGGGGSSALRCRLQGRARRRSSPARTSRRAPERPATPCSPPVCSPGTPPTTRPRPCSSTSCAGAASTAWPGCERCPREGGRVDRCSPSGGPRPSRCARHSACSPSPMRRTPTLPTVATGSATSCSRSPLRSPNATSPRCSPAKPTLLRDEADLLDRLGGRNRPRRQPLARRRAAGIGPPGRATLAGHRLPRRPSARRGNRRACARGGPQRAPSLRADRRLADRTSPRKAVDHRPEALMDGVGVL